MVRPLLAREQAHATPYVSAGGQQADRPRPFSLAKDLKAIHVEARQDGADRSARFVITPINTKTKSGTLGGAAGKFPFAAPVPLSAGTHYSIDVEVGTGAATLINGVMYFDGETSR